MKKILIVDTSVLLHDPTSIHGFQGNDVILPLVVLEELDRFKDRQDLLGESARYANRYLDKLRMTTGNLHTGIKCENDQTIKVETEFETNNSVMPLGLDITKGDNQIICSAINAKAKNPGVEVKVVTKDINLRVKCDALGIIAEDYYKDHIKSIKDGNQLYSGWKTINIPANDFIQDFYVNGSIQLSELKEVSPDYDYSFFENEFVVGISEIDAKSSFIGIHKAGKILKIDEKKLKIKPRSKEQSFAVHLLTDPEIPLVSISGLAGSGKTYLTICAALDWFNENKSKDGKIVITRSIQQVGKDMGFLPGDLQEKMAPWLSPIVDNFRQACGKSSTDYFDKMVENGDIEIAPLAYIRGRTFERCFIIVDEAQNTNIHELKTIITRTGENSKIVLLGDIDQIDTPYIDRYSNGLTITVEKLKDSELVGHVTLERGERSKIATLVSKKL